MINDSSYIEEITHNTNKLQSELKYYKLINIRNKILRILIKSGITVDYVLPFLCSMTICYQGANLKPFHLDNIKTYASIKTIDTNKIHLVKESYKMHYSENSVEYTTGFVKNNDIYERTVTTYKLNKDDIKNIDNFIKMTYDELNENLSIKKERIVQQKYLRKNDYLYMNDTTIVTKSREDENKYKIKKQNKRDDLVDIFIYLFWSISMGLGIHEIKEKLISKHLRKKLKSKEDNYKDLSKVDLEDMKQILLLNKNNLQLFGQNKENFQLRKKNK